MGLGFPRGLVHTHVKMRSEFNNIPSRMSGDCSRRMKNPNGKSSQDQGKCKKKKKNFE